MTSMAWAIGSASRPTASATRASSAFISRTISSGESVSIFSEAGLRASVVRRDMRAGSQLCILVTLRRHCNPFSLASELAATIPQTPLLIIACMLCSSVWLDILVLVAYLASAMVVGLFVSGGAKNVEAFLLGDRNLALVGHSGVDRGDRNERRDGAERAGGGLSARRA